MKRWLYKGMALSLVALIPVAGCVKRPTTLGPDTGLAYTLARDHQTLNLNAVKNLEPTQGLEDGTAAKHTMERYRSSFEKPESYRTTITSSSLIGQGMQQK